MVTTPKNLKIVGVVAAVVILVGGGVLAGQAMTGDDEGPASTMAGTVDTSGEDDAPATSEGSVGVIDDPVVTNTCWDGSQVEAGTPCSTDYDQRAIYWVFDIDAAEFGCDGGAQFSDKWAYAHEQCSFPPDGDAIHLAIHFSKASRDGRLPEYGDCDVVDDDREIMLCSGGASNSQLIRYNSDIALFYASGSQGEEAELASVRQRMRSLDEVLYGIETDQ